MSSTYTAPVVHAGIKAFTAIWSPTADVAREAGHRPQSLRAIHTKCVDCSVIVRKPETRAGQYLRSRFLVPPGHADLIADLAGLGTGAGHGLLQIESRGH